VPTASRDGRVLAYTDRPFFGPAGRRIATVEAPPPAPPADRCLIPGQEHHADAGSFAPDGSAFAHDDTVFDPDLFETVVGQGIFVMDIDLDAADCGLSSARLIIPGGAQPDWGPAAP
jgi:hypothetical protein